MLELKRTYEIMKVKQDVLQMIELNKLKWYRHILKMNDEHLQKFLTD